MSAHIPGPTLDDVAIRIGDVQRSSVAVVLERDDFGLVAVAPQPLGCRVELGVVEVEREVNVHTAAAAGDPELRSPQADPRQRPGHHPDAPTFLPTVDDREPEDAGVERLGSLEVDDLQHELADPADRDTCHGNANGSRAGGIPTAARAARLGASVRPMTDPVSWLQIEQGWKVVAADGTAVGTVAQIEGDKQSDIFDGLAVAAAESKAVVYVPGEVVGSIFPGAVTLKIASTEAAALEPFKAAPPETTFRPGKAPLATRLSRWLGGKR